MSDVYKEVPFNWLGKTIMVGLRVYTYTYGDKLAIHMMMKNEYGASELFAYLTYNLPYAVQLEENEAIINPDVMEYGIVKFLQKNHLVKRVWKAYNGFMAAAFDFDVLREFDSFGLDIYLHNRSQLKQR